MEQKAPHSAITGRTTQQSVVGRAAEQMPKHKEKRWCGTGGASAPAAPSSLRAC